MREKLCKPTLTIDSSISCSL